MTKHDCNVPAGSEPTTWTCPVCRRSWRFNPKAGSGTDLWHGNDNVRLPNGQRPKTTFLSWLFE